MPRLRRPRFPEQTSILFLHNMLRQEKGPRGVRQCSDFPCSKFRSDEEYRQLKGTSSYPSNKKLMPNQKLIREHGIVQFIQQTGENE